MNTTIPPALRVLVVDDDDFTLEFVSDQLRALGVKEVTTATDGAKALALLDKMGLFTPDLLICDLQMPGMDGIEFLRNLGEQHYAGSICLFSGTHLSILEAAKRLALSHDLDILGVLEKPVEEAHLLEVLAKVGAVHHQRKAIKSVVELSPEELRAGMAQGALIVLFQPKVLVSSRRVVGAECLVRFRHPQHGLLEPACFIYVAEAHQMIDALTREVLRQASQQLAIWQAAGEELQLSVNVSMLNLHELDVPETYERIVREAGVKPENFLLEITESALPEKTVITLDILLRLRLKGFKFSLDDFGTGYSTMQSLSQLPFSELKLDQQFVQAACFDHKAMAILESSANLGKSLSLSLVAEGVEQQQEWSLVQQLGCDEVQGYFVAKPMPGAELLDWKREWEAAPPSGG